MSNGSAVESRIAELGLELPAVAAPVAAYVPAVVTGSWVHTSGQLPFVDGQLPATGKVSASGAAGTVSTPWPRSRRPSGTWTGWSGS